MFYFERQKSTGYYEIGFKVNNRRTNLYFIKYNSMVPFRLRDLVPCLTLDYYGLHLGINLGFVIGIQILMNDE